MIEHARKHIALDGLRGYFVLLTFMVHYTPNIQGFGHPTFWGKILQWFQTSNYGVYGFFILSGFLIGRMWLASPDRSYTKFLYHRFLRIYPAFLLSMLLSACIGIYYTHYMPWGWDAKIIAQNLVFFNGWFSLGEITSYNFVSWSLFYEFVFYFTAPLIIWAARRSGSVFGSVLSAYLVIAFVSIALTIDSPFYLFFAGWAIASFSDEKLKSLADALPEKLLIASYMATTTAYSLSFINRDVFVFIFALLASLVLIRANYSEGLLSRLFRSRFMVELGRISYSFYLMHAMVIIVYFFTFQKLFPDMPKIIGLLFPFASLPIVFALTLAASILLYNVTERFYFKQAPLGASIFKEAWALLCWQGWPALAKRSINEVKRIPSYVRMARGARS